MTGFAEYANYNAPGPAPLERNREVIAAALLEDSAPWSHRRPPLHPGPGSS